MAKSDAERFAKIYVDTLAPTALSAQAKRKILGHFAYGFSCGESYADGELNIGQFKAALSELKMELEEPKFTIIKPGEA